MSLRWPLRPAAMAGVLGVLWACAEESMLEVRVALPSPTPVSGITVSAVPYDLPSILDSLTRTSPVRPPDYRELERELLGYRQGDGDSLGNLHAQWLDARRAVAALADSLDRVGRGAPGYSAAYARFRAAYQALARDEAQLESAVREQTAPDRDFADRVARAADSLRAWEAQAFRDLDRVVDRQNEHQAVTDSTGHASLHLPAGRWWVVARRPHETNPYLEYAWNVPVTSSSLVPVITSLGAHNVTLRWRR